MKTLILTTLALAAGMALVHAQGTITISATSAEVYTNDGLNAGPARGATGSYYFEVLDMTQNAWASLTSLQQIEAYNIFGGPQGVSFWTDSGVSGGNSVLHAGGITSSTTATAANWAAPTSAAGYNTAPNYDYYTVVGWSANVGTSWSVVSAEIQSGIIFTIPGTTALGQSGEAYNYSGGGPGALPSVDMWGASPTGLAGSGGLPTVDGLTLYIGPEPTTLALVGLGSISMLFLRRRKS